MTYSPSFIVWELGRWANDMWVRFGGEGVKVYLVGSRVHKADGKDVDISIVLPTQMFKDRYGMTEKEWIAERSRFENGTGVVRMNEWAPAQVRWAKEVGGLVSDLAKITTQFGPPDLKVMSEEWQEDAHRHGARVRIDTVVKEGGM